MFLFSCLYSGSVLAQDSVGDVVSSSDFGYKEEILGGKVTSVLEENNVKNSDDGDTHPYQKLLISVTKGSIRDGGIVVENGNIESVNIPKYKVGDKVLVSYSKDFEGNDVFYITDFIRWISLLVLFLVFVVLTVAIAKVRGFLSILGMGASFLVIFLILLSRILSGEVPVTTLIASLVVDEI